MKMQPAYQLSKINAKLEGGKRRAELIRDCWAGTWMAVIALQPARGTAGPPTAALWLPYIATGAHTLSARAARKTAQSASMFLLVKEIPRHSEPVEEATPSQAWASAEISAAHTSQLSPLFPLTLV